MPGGKLSSWLDDEPVPAVRKCKLPSVSWGGRAEHAVVVDADATSPDNTMAGGGKANRLHALAEKEAWDPFSSSTSKAREDAPDAFERLREGAAAAAGSTSASTPPVPAWREPTKPPPSSSWDPFGAAASEGKENRGNAFSKLLAATPTQQKGRAARDKLHTAPKRSLGGPGKKTKLSGGGGGGSASEAEAVTRFCECPVCGKRVRFCVSYVVTSGIFMLPRSSARDSVTAVLFVLSTCSVNLDTYKAGNSLHVEPMVKKAVLPTATGDLVWIFFA